MWKFTELLEAKVIRWKVSRDGDRKEDDRKQGGNTAPRDKWLTIDQKEPS